jgi:hypothetical protein
MCYYNELNISMERIKVAPAYSPEYLETERPQPLSDAHIESLIQDVLSGKMDSDISDKVYSDFKQEMTNWLFSSKLNNVTGFDSFDRVDIINGCTQFIDNIYMHGQPQILVGDYRYHDRLGNWGTRPGILREDVPLIIAMPFPDTGSVHTNMKEILDEAQDKGIGVHVDGAWLTCCHGIDFDLSHPSIRSIGISLSKGLGLGWNRIGLRWTRQTHPDSVTIMNDFHMNNRALVKIGLHFIRNLPADYLWTTYGNTYYKICKDFGLMPTNSIHIAMSSQGPVGISPLIRLLHNA